MKEFNPNAPIVGAVPSPCISVCTMHPQSGLCQGCFRTLNEIAQWSTATEQTKRTIWIALLERRDRSFG